MKRVNLKKILSLLLVAGILVGSIPSCVWAYEDEQGNGAVANDVEYDQIDGIETEYNQNSDINTEIEPDSEEEPNKYQQIQDAKHEDSDADADDNEDIEVSETDIDKRTHDEESEVAQTVASEITSNGNVHKNPSKSDDNGESYEELLEEIEDDISALKEGEEGKDYSESELVYLCDSTEEAEEVAKRYSEESGMDIVVKDYSFGVATLEIVELGSLQDEDAEEEPAEEYISSVIDIIGLAADEERELPILYPNLYMQIESIEANTINESFLDPNTKWKDEDGNKNTKFQWGHEIVGSKNVWEAIDNGYLTTNSQAYDTYKESLEHTVVAVVDSGIYKAGKDFHIINDEGVEEPIYVGAYNFTTEDPEAYDDELKSGHGTHVAGIIADAANDYQGRGIAAGVKLMPLRVTDAKGSASSVNMIKALNYAVASRLKYDGTDPGEAYASVPAYNVQAMNISIGGYRYNSSYQKVINDVLAAGIVICASAGNDAIRGKHYPSSYDGVISVAAVDSQKMRALYSCYGPDVDIAAPGGETNGYKDGRNHIYNMSGDDFKVTEYIYASGTNKTAEANGLTGTSMASPVVTATCALIKAKYPDMRPEDVEALIKSTATPVYGDEIGVGCVNAAKALGIDLIPNKPVSSLKDGAYIYNDTDIMLRTDSDEAVIYYTLNGKDPDPVHMQETGTMIYDSKDPAHPDTYIHIDYEKYADKNAKVELKAVALKFSNLSPVSTYTYYCDSEAVRDITITGEANVSAVIVGKKLNLSATVRPASAKNTNVIWVSSDTSVAEVSLTGVVTGRSAGTAMVKAIAADGYGAVSNEMAITVMPSATNVEIDLPHIGTKMYDSSTIQLYTAHEGIVGVDSTYNLGIKKTVGYVQTGCVNVWPKEALQQVVYKSSNPKVVTVDADGNVVAVGSGKATVTVTAADGSGKKDTQKFAVVTPVYSLEIQDSNTSITSGAVATGYKFTPKAIFNGGQSEPYDKKLVWSIERAATGTSTYIDPAKVASINPGTGVVTCYKNVAIAGPVTLRICATSKAGVSGDVSAYIDVVLYKGTESIQYNTGYSAYKDNKMNLSADDWYYLAILTKTTSEGGNLGRTMDFVQVSSSNPNVALPSATEGKLSSIKLYCFSEGKTTITIKALDGTNKKFKMNVECKFSSSTSLENIGLVCTSGDDIYYPGKELKYTIVPNDGLRLSDLDSYEYAFANEDVTKKIRYDFISIDSRTGEIRKIPGSADPTVPMNVYIYASAQKSIEKKTAVAHMQVYPSATNSVVVDNIVMSGGKGHVYYDNGKYIFDHVGDRAKLKVHSVPETSCQSGYIYESSNPEVVRVYQTGEIELLRNGSARISVMTPDGTRKKTKVDIVVDQTRVRGIYLDKTTMELSTIAVGGKNTKDVFTVSSIVPDDVNTGFIVSTSNKNVATVTVRQKTTDSETDVFEVNAVGSGNATIKVMADDGSKTYTTLRVNVSNPVTDINLRSSTGSYILKPGKKLKIYAKTNAATDKSVTFDYYASSEEEKNQMRQYASLDAVTGEVVAKSNETDEEHVVKIYAKAADYGGFTSRPINIVISPAKVLMKNISVVSSTDIYDLSEGKTLKMSATTTMDATDRRITWQVDNYVGGRVDNSDSAYATISSSGTLKPSGAVKTVRQVLVTAKALDGSNVSGGRVVTLYPPLKKTDIDSVAIFKSATEDFLLNVGGIHEMSVGDELTLDIKGYGPNDTCEGDDAPCQKYYVTYSAKGKSGIIPGKVYLMNGNGTKVKIIAIDKGTITVYATAIDGSNKKTSYSVNVK